MYEQFKDRLQGMDLTAASPLFVSNCCQKQGTFSGVFRRVENKAQRKITLPYPDLPRQQVSAMMIHSWVPMVHQLKSSSLPGTIIKQVGDTMNNCW